MLELGGASMLGLGGNIRVAPLGGAKVKLGGASILDIHVGTAIVLKLGGGRLKLGGVAMLESATVRL